MRKLFVFSLIWIGTLLGACSDEKEPVVYPNDGKLSISTRVNANLNSFVFSIDDKIGLFVASDGSDNWNKENPYSNIMVTSFGINRNSWKVEKDVLLDDASVMVFAYFPYDENVKSPLRIPVEIDRQGAFVDYLYGSNRQSQKVNRESPQADIILNHALAMLQFDISIDPEQPYYGTGIIDDARIIALNESGELIQNKQIIQRGYLNCITGDIEPIHWGSVAITDLIGKSFKSDFSGKYPVCMVAPTYNMTNTAFMIQVDGKKFYIRLPEGTTWAKNTKNRYVITLSGEVMKFDPDSVIVEDWNTGDHTEGEFGGGDDF